MSTISASPKPPPRRERPAAWLRTDAGEKRAWQIGIAGTLLAHLILLLLAPHLENLNFLQDNTTLNVETPETPQSFDIEMAPNAFIQQPEPPPMHFVEVNPNVADNVPDQTSNFSFQNQQVAQEKPTPNGKSDAPALEGDKEHKSEAIVSGRLNPPQPAAPPVPDTEAADAEQKEQKLARMEVNPLPGLVKTEGDSADAFGSNIAKITPNPDADAKEKIDGSPDSKEKDGDIQGAKFKIDPKRPAQRPHLAASEINARPAPLMNNEFGTQNIGPVAYNAKWSNYGEYLKRLIDTVQVQWERINNQTGAWPPPGTQVVVKFKINSKGEVTDVAPPDSNGGMQAKYACVSAITARAPYGEWTDDMIAVLGQSQELTFSFFYY